MNKESVRKQIQLVNVDGSVKMPDGTFTSAEFAMVKFISEMETMQETIESQNKQVSYWMGQGQKAEKEAEALQIENERLAMELSVYKEGSEIAYQTIVDEKQELKNKLKQLDGHYQDSLDQIRKQHLELEEVKGKLVTLQTSFRLCLNDAEYFSYRLNELGADFCWNRLPHTYEEALKTTSTDIQRFREFPKQKDGE